MSLSFPGGPWSLVRRFSVLVLTVGLVSLAIQFVVLRLWTAPLIDDHAQALASQVHSIHTALRLAPAAQRAALAQALSRGPVRLAREAPEDFADYGGDVTGTPSRSQAPMTPFANRLAAVLGAVKLHDGSTGNLLFELPVEGNVWWLTLRAPPAPQVLVNTALLWVALLSAATLLAIVFGLRWIARPVRTLAHEITQQRGNLRPLAADPQASAEIQALVRAFNELVHANAMAASLRQQLLAGVSHDLRTPLTRLRLRIETQCEPPLSDALEADLLALQHIVDQFLAYVQGDTGLRLGRDRPVQGLIAEVADSYAAQGLDVTVEPPSGADADGPAEAADTAGADQAAGEPLLPDLAMRRLLENLVNNALAHGEPPVRLSLHADGLSWLLCVVDHGAGMGAAAFSQARQPFVRLNDTRGALGHCGLGLAIVDQIAQQLDATLDVRPRSPTLPFAVQLRWPRRAVHG